MKKGLSSLIIFALLLGGGLPVQAETEVGLFEALENLSKLQSYASLQTFTGSFQMDEGENFVDVKFKLNVKSQVNNRAAFQSNSATEIRGQFNAAVEGPNKPFDHLDANFKAELTLVVEEGIYARLKELNFEAAGVPESERAEFEQSQQELQTMVEPILNQWFFLPFSDLTGLSEAQPGLEGLFSQEEILKALEEKGMKETYSDLAKQSLQAQVEAGVLSPENATVSNELIDMVLAAKFLRTKTITKGNNKNFQAFALDKRLITKFVKELAQKVNEEMSEEDLKELEMILSQVGFSGIYRVDPRYRIFDNFLVRFRIREIEEVKLKLFEISYRARFSQINAAPTVAAPADYKPLSESGLPIPFLYQPELLEEGLEDEEGALEEELDVIEGEMLE